MRQVEFTEPYRIETTQFVAGDRHTFSDEEAATFIRIGVAKCVETGEQGERKPGAHQLQVDGISQEL